MSDNDRLIKNKVEDTINYGSPENFVPYPKEHLRLELYDGEKRKLLKESIEANGVMTPVIVMPGERGKLIIISGHNRVDVCRELGIEVPYILKTDLTEEQADSLCIDTNLLVRQLHEYKKSKLAIILARKYDIASRQGFKLGEQVDTAKDLGNEYNLSPATIKRYVRISNLNRDLMKKLDEGAVSFIAAYHLAFLKETPQKVVFEYMNKNGVKFSIAQSEYLHNTYEHDVTITEAQLDALFVKVPKEKTKINIPIKSIKSIVPQDDMDRIDEIIVMALKEYYQK